MRHAASGAAPPAPRIPAGGRQFAMLPLFGASSAQGIWLIRLAQVAFFAALIFTFYSAVIPPQKAVQLVPWDKAEHFLAFYALTGLAVAAFRGAICSSWRLAIGIRRLHRVRAGTRPS